MSQDGPLLRILQHPYYDHANHDVHIETYTNGAGGLINTVISILTPEEQLEGHGDGYTYFEAMDAALSDILELMNDLQWPYDPAEERRRRMDSIAADNPSLTRRNI